MQSAYKSEEEERYDVEMLQQVQQQIHKYKERTKMIEELLHLAVQKVQIQSRTSDEFVNPFGRLRTGNDSTGRAVAQESLKHLKLNFPRFAEGKGVADWIEDCELYFEIYGIQNNKKVVIAGMHLEGLAKSWYQMYALEKLELNWQDFCNQFTARFGVKENELLIERFKNLKQDDTVELYCKKFAECMRQMKVKMPQLTEGYYVECFIRGNQACHEAVES